MLARCWNLFFSFNHMLKAFGVVWGHTSFKFLSKWNCCFFSRRIAVHYQLEELYLVSFSNSIKARSTSWRQPCELSKWTYESPETWTCLGLNDFPTWKQSEHEKVKQMLLLFLDGKMLLSLLVKKKKKPFFLNSKSIFFLTLFLLIWIPANVIMGWDVCSFNSWALWSLFGWLSGLLFILIVYRAKI